MNKLFIDTSDNKITKVSLVVGKKTFSKDYVRTTVRKSGETLLLIEYLVKKAKIEISEIDEVQVKEGPGSFTGIKIGASIANTLSFALNIPINGKEPGTIIVPVYE